MFGVLRLLLIQSLCYGILAQSTSSLFIVGFGEENSLSGEVIGTGAAGTTYILEGIDPLDTTTIPFTMTLIQGSEILVETAVIPSDSNFGAFALCTFSGSGAGAAALCENVIQGGPTTTTVFATFAATSVIPIPISTGTPPEGFTFTLPDLSSGASTGTGSTSPKSTITSLGPTNTNPQTTTAPTTTTVTANGACARMGTGVTNGGMLMVSLAMTATFVMAMF